MHFSCLCFGCQHFGGYAFWFLKSHWAAWSYSGDLRRLCCLRELHFWATWTGQPEKITYHLPKVCVHLFHGQDEYQVGIFWAILVLYGLRVMHEEGKCEVWIFGFFRSKSSNLEGQKIWDMLGQISLYLRKYKYLAIEVFWWNVAYCMGVWMVTFDFWFSKFFILHGFRWFEEVALV